MGKFPLVPTTNQDMAYKIKMVRSVCIYTLQTYYQHTTSSNVSRSMSQESTAGLTSEMKAHLREEIDQELANQPMATSLLNHLRQIIQIPGTITLINPGYVRDATATATPERLVQRALHCAGHPNKISFVQHGCTWRGVAYVYLHQRDPLEGFGPVRLASSSVRAQVRAMIAEVHAPTYRLVDNED